MTFVRFYSGKSWEIPDHEAGRSVIVPHHEGDIFLYALLKPDVRSKLSETFAAHLEDVAQQVELVETWMGVLDLKHSTENDRDV